MERNSFWCVELGEVYVQILGQEIHRDKMKVWIVMFDVLVE